MGYMLWLVPCHGGESGLQVSPRRGPLIPK